MEYYMRIAISATANHPASSVEPHFEHATYYIIIDSRKSGQRRYKAVHNPGVNSVNDVGILAAQMLINLGIDILITGWCDPHALRVFQKAKIPIYKASPCTVQTIINTLKDTEFDPDKLANNEKK